MVLIGYDYSVPITQFKDYWATLYMVPCKNIFIFVSFCGDWTEIETSMMENWESMKPFPPEYSVILWQSNCNAPLSVVWKAVMLGVEWKLDKSQQISQSVTAEIWTINNNKQ